VGLYPHLNDSITYRRPDGVVIGTGLQLKNMNFNNPMPSGFFQKSDGTYISGVGLGSSPWVGPAGPNVVGTNANTCTDWTDSATPSAAAFVGDPMSAISWMFGNGFSALCSFARPVFCVEQ
jgi:hypothetical protein